jgi:NAD(P)-dependent dehydrogenase (short-subunit alcohol dehydrogenase family)
MATAVPFADLEGLSPKRWDATMRVNPGDPWLIACAAEASLKRRGRGRIVNVPAMAGLKPVGASVAQSVSKAALTQLTRCLAVAMAPGVAASCVAPGLMEGTELTRNIPDAVRDAFAARAVLGTTTSMEDAVGQAVKFCRSRTGTGWTAAIDGGIPFHRPWRTAPWTIGRGGARSGA